MRVTLGHTGYNSDMRYFLAFHGTVGHVIEALNLTDARTEAIRVITGLNPHLVGLEPHEIEVRPVKDGELAALV